MDVGFGPAEKSLAVVIALLFVIYAGLQKHAPIFFEPELRQASASLALSIDEAPRRGTVNLYGDYRTSVSDFLSSQRLKDRSGVSPEGMKRINYFALWDDGQTYPANAFFLGFVPFETKKLWVPLVAIALRVRYQRDQDNPRLLYRDDCWQTSVQTYRHKSGDCEDHAILLADWLMGLGYDARVVLGEFNGEGHAWVVLHKDDQRYLLESTNKSSRRRYPLVAAHPEYREVFMFNRDYFWAKAADPQPKRKASAEWVLLSKFLPMH